MVRGIPRGVFGAPQSTDAVAAALRPCQEGPVGTGCQSGGGREGEGADDANDLHGLFWLVVGGFASLGALEKGTVCVFGGFS